MTTAITRTGLFADVRRVNAGVELMGTSIAMIDRHYGHSHGHLASDSRDRAVALLDALRARQHRQRSTRAS